MENPTLRITKKLFVELSGCSGQLVDLYSAKGMPKHPHPTNKKVNMFDMKECKAWAHEHKYFSFEKKIDTVIEKIPAIETVETDEGYQSESFPEGSTAEPVMTKADDLNELERWFEGFMRQLRKCEEKYFK